MWQYGLQTLLRRLHLIHCLVAHLQALPEVLLRQVVAQAHLVGVHLHHPAPLVQEVQVLLLPVEAPLVQVAYVVILHQALLLPVEVLRHPHHLVVVEVLHHHRHVEVLHPAHRLQVLVALLAHRLVRQVVEVLARPLLVHLRRILGKSTAMPILIN